MGFCHDWTRREGKRFIFETGMLCNALSFALLFISFVSGYWIESWPRVYRYARIHTNYTSPLIVCLAYKISSFWWQEITTCICVRVRHKHIIFGIYMYIRIAFNIVVVSSALDYGKCALLAWFWKTIRVRKLTMAAGGYLPQNFIPLKDGLCHVSVVENLHLSNMDRQTWANKIV